MLETALVLLAVAAGGLVWIAGEVTAPFLATAGLIVLLVGLALGLPTGFWYHVLLYRCVSPRVRLGRTWWLSPARLHPHLTAPEHRRIRGWYRAGGVGFLLCVIGGVSALGGLLLARW